MLANEMPEEVVEIVVQLSEGDFANGVKPAKLQRKKIYVEQVLNAPPHIRKQVLLISAVDKLSAYTDDFPLSLENAQANLYLYRELMPHYLNSLKPYPRLYKEMQGTWSQLEAIWNQLI